MRHSSKSGAFLVELIIVIAFFAVASAICVRLFAHAHSISTQSRDLHMAASQFQTAAECFKVCGGDEAALLAVLPGSERGGLGQLDIRYDANWNLTEAEDCHYRLEIRLGEEADLATANIDVYRAGSDRPLFQGSVYSYA